jgi:hypothetical protein
VQTWMSPQPTAGKLPFGGMCLCSPANNESTVVWPLSWMQNLIVTPAHNVNLSCLCFMHLQSGTFSPCPRLMSGERAWVRLCRPETAAKPAAERGPRKGMQLGKARKANDFLDSLRAEGEIIQVISPCVLLHQCACPS